MGRSNASGRWIFLISLIIVGLCLGLISAAEGSISLEEEIKHRSIELKTLSAQIRKNREKRRKAAEQEQSILSALQEIEDHIRLRGKKLDVLRLKIQKKDEQMDQLGLEIKALQQSMSEKKKVITKRMRELYKEGTGTTISILLSAKNTEDFEKRVHYLKWDTKRQQQFLEQFKKKVNELDDKNQEFDQVRTEWSLKKEELFQELLKVREEKQSKKILLTSIQTDRLIYEKAASELDEASRQLQSLLKDLRKRHSEDKDKKGFARQKGRLIWPNPGEVVAFFGKQKHPKFDTYIFRKGIDIRPDPRESVKAVYSGKVIYADWFRGYGMVIILDHGDNYYSLYAHLADLMVSVGDSAKKNKVIGRVGDTGLVQGNRLYFEIRYQGEPMDPLAWLSKRPQGGKR